MSRRGARHLARATLAGVLAAASVLVAPFGGTPQAAASTGGSVAAVAPSPANPTLTATTAPALAAQAATPSVQILSTSPQFPSSASATLKITVRITNPTSTALSGLSLALERGDPITQEATLESAFANPPATTDVDIPPTAVTASVAPGRSTDVVITTTTGHDQADGTLGLCLSGCNSLDGIYPVDVALLGATPDGNSNGELARAHTFIPSFRTEPDSVRVSWLWPLIDRPHRELSETEFIDDDLATSVAAGGRLDRALKVAELTRGQVRLTLIIDPELIDALSVMSKGYDVRTATGVKAGTGKAAAGAWLARLSAVAGYEDVSLTPYSDPDVDALARAGQSWSTTLPTDVAARVRAVLGAGLVSDIAWPPGESLSGAGLDSVVANGGGEVLLSSAALSNGQNAGASTNALAPLPASTGKASALVLSPRLQPDVLAATSVGGSSPALTQRLLARLAVRAMHQPNDHQFAVAAPTRYVDADPAATAALMTTLVAAPFADDFAARSAPSAVIAADHGSLTGATGTEIAPAQLAALSSARSQITTFRDCLDDADANELFGGLPTAILRGQSAAWRNTPIAGQAFAESVRTAVKARLNGVSIAQPANASYTLASQDAPLLITVENNLAVAVTVRVQVSPAPGVRGFSASSVPATKVLAHGRTQMKVDTHTERSGRFQIQVVLLTPHDVPLSDPLPLRVRSTALGAVALWITGVSFAVLLVALAIRAVRRFRRRGQVPETVYTS